MTPLQETISRLFPFVCAGAALILPALFLLRVLSILAGAMANRREPEPGAPPHVFRDVTWPKYIFLHHSEDEELAIEVRRWVWHGAGRKSSHDTP